MQSALGWYWATSAPLTAAGTYNVSATADDTALPFSSGAAAVVQVLPGAPMPSNTRYTSTSNPSKRIFPLAMLGSCDALLLVKSEGLSACRLVGSGTLNQTTAGASLLVEAFLQDAFLNNVTDPTVLKDAQAELLLGGDTTGSIAFQLAQDPSW